MHWLKVYAISLRELKKKKGKNVDKEDSIKFSLAFFASKGCI